MPDTTTITVRVDKSVKKRLDNLARETKRSKSALAAEGIGAFVELEERQIAGIKQAMESLDRGLGIDHDDVVAWVDSWDSDNETPPPRSA